MLKLKATTGPITDRLRQTSQTDGLGAILETQVPTSLVHSVCGYCSTGCGLQVHLQGNQPINLIPRASYPVNAGMACPKGWEALTVLNSPDRAEAPLWRDRKAGVRTELSWDEAAIRFCDSIRAIQNRHGPDSIAFLSSGQIPTEEMLLLGALAKFGMGIRHGDGNTRQCMATSVVAYKQSFGYDAPPFTYADFEESDLLIFIGSNPCLAHPILWQRVLQNPRSPKIVVIDPRKTETAMAADEHWAIRPKSDLELLYGLANQLVKMEAIDRSYIAEHTTGFEAFVEFVQPFTLERVSKTSSIAIERLEQVCRWIASGARTSFWWTMGVNQSYQGVRTAQAIINLALMTGNIGRPGTGANSITGQCNAMGSRLYSNTTSLLGHRDFTDAEHRREVAEKVGVPVESIPRENGWAYNEIMDGIEQGKIKGLWVIATNTAHSWIDSRRARRLLDKLDFLVVQDMYHSTDTAKMADLLLPAAGWGEKEGTFINSERRIGLTQKVSRAPGQALADFHIFRLLARAWGGLNWFEQWKTPADAFETMKELSRGRPHDFSGITSYQQIDQYGGIQWPWPDSRIGLDSADLEPTSITHRRLFEDGQFYHSDRRAKFIFESPIAMPDAPNQEYPFLLMTGRGSASQWHTETRTSKSPILRQLYPKDPYVEINPEDAAKLGLENQQWVQVVSPRGAARVRVLVTATVQPSHLFMPMHNEQTNFLTRQHIDPYSKQPSFKNTSVQLVPMSV
jgi:assimilatory nitrate reductase catalytic subunit